MGEFTKKQLQERKEKAENKQKQLEVKLSKYTD